MSRMACGWAVSWPETLTHAAIAGFFGLTERPKDRIFLACLWQAAPSETAGAKGLGVERLSP